MGLDVYLVKGGDTVCMDSTVHPKHLFKVGYFRSSYNEAGFNEYLRRMGIADLYEIFGLESGGSFIPDWEAALGRCVQAIAELETRWAGPMKDVDVFVVENLRVRSDVPVSEEAALAAYQEDFQPPYRDHDYLGSRGYFFPRGVTVLALIPGVVSTTLAPVPCTYVIYRNSPTYVWYLSGLQVVRETIEYVLASTEREQYRLTWSG